MKGYSYTVDEKELENHAFSRAEGVEASYKDLSQVCGCINGRKVAWALDFLQKAAEGSIPILYKKFNTNLGHRRELGGSKGRYPKKAALAVLKAIKSVAANARIKGLSEDLTIVHVLANKKDSMPRMQPKGRRFRSDYETARIEVIVKGPLAIEKKVEVKAPEKKPEHKPESKSESKPETHHETKVEVKQEKDHIKKETHPETKKVDLSKLRRGEIKK
ncbi:50S ribosomal protein L22 [Candidatus Micrarchaeota archaeon]|nr:50S ribosomal protein L22 [Candidatus Micrarchaeota archaeon]